MPEMRCRSNTCRGRILGALLISSLLTICSGQTTVLTNNYSRPPVHPRRNVEDFPAVPAKFVRFNVFKTNVREPCLDELEIYTEKDSQHNVALATLGARASASSTLPGYQIHQIQWLNDGLYGNTHSWIAGSESNVWAQIELPAPMQISRVVWGRDREGYLIDRLPTDYRIEVSMDGVVWKTVATAADRRSLPAGEIFAGYGPAFRQSVIRFSPTGATLSPENQNISPEYRVDHWQTEDGLPGNEVTALLQTRDGYLWIGTSSGLARFDGVKFTKFGEQDGLKNSRILCLLEDRRGRLWVGTDGGGLFCFVDKIFQAVTTRDGLFSDVVMSLAQGADDRIWIGTYAGLNCWREGQFLQDPPVPPRRESAVSRVLEDGSGLWVVLNGFLHQVKGQDYFRENLGGEPGSQIAIAALRRGASGRIWFGGLSGRLACSVDGVMDTVPQPGTFSSDTILDICEARDGDVWIALAASGLRRLRNGDVISLSVPDGLADNSVRCLLEDREGNIWAGTGGGGLNRIKRKKLRLVTASDGLSYNGITSLAEDEEGRIWIGSNGGGLSVAKDGNFSPSDLSYLLDNESLPSLLVSRNGSLWLGTWNSGLFCKTGSKLEQYHLGTPENEQPVLALCENRAGGLWVGTYQEGLKFFNDGVFRQCRATNAILPKYITSLTQDDEGRLWIGSGGDGLFCLVGEELRTLSSSHGLPSDFVRTLHLDAEGVLWIGTSRGLGRLKAGRLRNLTAQQGLWDEVISQILEDAEGQLWFGSNRGIFRQSKRELDDVMEGRKQTLNPQTFGKGEGLENLECTGGFSPAGLRTRDGRLWFSTVKGLAVVDPANIPKNRVAPALWLEEVHVNGVRQDLPFESGNPGLKTSPLLEVAPGAQRVAFHYTALSFTAPEKVRFRYRLEGIDRDWVEAGGRRIAEYPLLLPGEYRFRVSAINEDGVESANEAGITLICHPAFWQTSWFRVLAITIVVGSAGWAVKVWATRRLRRRLALLEHEHALEQEKTRIARDIHDELGALLTEISMISDHSQQRLDSPKELESELRRISKTAREAVQTADGIVWAVNPRNDSFVHLANYLVHFAEDFFRLTGIRCRLDVPATLPEIPISTQSRHHLHLAVKEACNNVVRHSEATEVWLRIGLTDSHFAITIEDNGKGFEVGTEAADSNGLINIRQRIAEVGGNYDLTTGPGRGTRVRLTVPVHLLKESPCPLVSP
jgi:ligand-binding sensor domain-containing protein/signal transduction histidine kinase